MDATPTTLAFVDPGLRKTPFFLEFRRHLPAGTRCVYYSRRFLVRGYIRSAQAELFPRVDILLPQARFEIDDDTLRTAVGLKECRRKGGPRLELARRLLSDLATFYDRYRPQTVLVWNGANLRVSLGAWLARRRGLRVIHAEHGYLPGTLQIDPRGVNHDNSLTAVAMAGQAELPPDPRLDVQLDAEIQAYRAGKPMRCFDTPVPDAYHRDLRTAFASRLLIHLRRIPLQHAAWVSRRLGLDRADALPSRFVLLPMQVRKDSQLVLHSPLLGNDLEALIRHTRDAVKAVDPALGLVVKLHPFEQLPVQRRNLRLIARFPDVHFMAATPIRALIDRAAAVVTVNSTVGFEGLLLDRPVVTLGVNFYTVPGLVHTVPELDAFPDVLRAALSEPVDSARRRAFLRWSCRHFLTFGSYQDFSEASLRAVAKRVVALMPVAATGTSAVERSANDRALDDAPLPA